MTAETTHEVREKGMLSLALLFLAVILTIRIVSLWFNNSELFYNEAQFWFWSQDLAFGYFSEPPLSAFLVSLTTSLCGTDSEFCVRLSAPILHTGSAILIFLAARRLFNAKTAFWSALIYASLPGISLSSTIMSADVPLLFFWSLAFYFYVRLTEEPDWRWGILMGISLGLAVNAKYVAVYFIGCALIHSLFEQQRMTPARLKVFWLGVLVAAFIVLPNLWWNLQNGFVTVSRVGDYFGWQGFSLQFKEFFEFFGSQFGVFGPILFGMFLATIFRMWGNSISYSHRLLASFSLPIILLVVFQALMSKAYANWAAAAYVAATILVAEIMVNRVPGHWLRSSMIIHGIAFLGLAVAVCFAGPGELKLPGDRNPFERTQGSNEIANQVRTRFKPDEFSSIVTTNRRMSAVLNYTLRDLDVPILAWRVGPRPNDHYQLVSAWQDQPQSPALLVTNADNIASIVDDFEKVTYLGSQRISAGEVREIHFYQLEGFQK